MPTPAANSLKPDSEEALLAGQLDYYGSRAAEYDQWWRRTGRYDRGVALNRQWREDAGLVEAALDAFAPAGRILELACGTGIWTERLGSLAETLTAVDGSAEVLAINRARLASARVDYIQSDLFRWTPDRQYDVVFFGFWLSHVPPAKFAGFWQMVAACLAPGGRVFFIDSLPEPSSTAVDHTVPSAESVTQRRRLNDGREFEIYKVYYEPAPLQARLAELGWNFRVERTPHYFIYGSGARS